ncbi:hypothetical protein EVAR_5072_1 [Eumeta japonica]|uniref:Uncharacterized protein n=1 Tax=Eumeta variegata TaxID=151549 RepID=A0A4C1SUY1_EUMVA|nr:hypothetical protein EVAR_5072_1 [Eumeta japonica]
MVGCAGAEPGSVLESRGTRSGRTPEAAIDADLGVTAGEPRRASCYVKSILQPSEAVTGGVGRKYEQPAKQRRAVVEGSVHEGTPKAVRLRAIGRAEMARPVPVYYDLEPPYCCDILLMFGPETCGLISKKLFKMLSDFFFICFRSSCGRFRLQLTVESKSQITLFAPYAAKNIKPSAQDVVTVWMRTLAVSDQRWSSAQNATSKLLSMRR